MCAAPSKTDFFTFLLGVSSKELCLCLWMHVRGKIDTFRFRVDRGVLILPKHQKSDLLTTQMSQILIRSQISAQLPQINHDSSEQLEPSNFRKSQWICFWRNVTAKSERAKKTNQNLLQLAGSVTMNLWVLSIWFATFYKLSFDQMNSVPFDSLRIRSSRQSSRSRPELRNAWLPCKLLQEDWDCHC